MSSMRRVFVTALTEEMQRGFNDLLAEAFFFAFAQAGCLTFYQGRAAARSFGRFGSDVFRCGRPSQSIFGAAHDTGPPAWCAACSARLNFDSGPYIIVTNEKLQVLLSGSRESWRAPDTKSQPPELFFEGGLLYRRLANRMIRRAEIQNGDSD